MNGRRVTALALLLSAMACTPVQAMAAGPATVPAASDPSAAPDPERLAIATEVIDQGFPAADREPMFFGAIDGLIAQLRTVHLAQIQNDPGAAAILNRKLDRYIAQAKDVLRTHIPALMGAMARAYSREFTKDELIQLRAFAATSAGRHFFLRSASLLRDPDFAAANVAYARELQPGLVRMRDELTAELKAYFMQHPPKPSSDS
ncbi:hypothetical protein [Novosphingobium sp.]|uniref:hypothetical protein n=1 Tax=Novosphingobium sp. TaxID=1874826 RepID=UPI0038BADFD5